MLPIQDGYTTFLLHIEIFSQRMLVFAFSCRLLRTNMHLLRPLTPPGKGRVYRLPQGW